MDTQFLNEHLLPGKIGQLLIIISFIGSLASFVAYTFSAQSRLIANEVSWKKLGRILFSIHALSVLSIFITLFYIIFNHYFEYHYAWSHSSKALPFKYLLSCFWEGQEGSFLLWTICHAFLSFFVIKSATKWEAPVMAVISLVQVILATTVLGIHIFDIKIGSTPFALLRDVMSGAPIFQQANYLEMVNDGNGLNPLLQNYWMVIHPPILFMGFASTLFPFAYTIAALWKKDYEELSKPLIRWALVAGMILGTGIMMGGAWAYESLNFGGYWAWDPVENASLVPWLIMIAGLHTAIIYKATGYSLKSTFLFFIFSFVLVLYSTFLTRTGVLGDTSVHSFTGEGNSLYYHLLFFISLFLGWGLFLFFKNLKQIPDRKKEEEALSSREFWMFIGALVLMISVVQITYTTSMPLWNKWFGTKLAITDPIMHYNKIQIWITFLILLGTACIYYLKFKKSNSSDFLKKISIPLIASFVLTASVAYFQELKSFPIILFTWASLFSACANLYYLITVINLKVIKWGGTTAHIGFALMMLGVLLSSYNKETISVNRLGVEFNMGKKTEEENRKESRENLLLFRGVPVTMNGYSLTYLGDTVAEPNHYYKVLYQKRENDTGRITEEFILKPNAQINPKMGLVSSPDTRHYLTHDIFTYVTSTVDKSKAPDTSSYTTTKVKKGDSIFFASGYMIFNGFAPIDSKSNSTVKANDIAVAAKLSVYDLNGFVGEAKPIYIIRDRSEIILEDTLSIMNLFTRVEKILPNENAVNIGHKLPSAMDDYIIMKAIKFPYINVLWIGTVLMIIGFFISLIKRITAK